MADIDVVKKPSAPGGAVREPGSRNTAWIWAVAAILAIGGLMAWLVVQSERISTAAAVQEQDDRREAPAAVGAGGPAEPAELAAVAADPDPFVGRRVMLENVEVAATLGPSAFWGDVPGANPFLVLFSPDVTQQPQLQSGQRLNLQGVINVVTDAALNEWEQSGAIRPGARDEASFATHYLLAEQIR